MHKAYLVAKREYLAAVRTRSFVVSLILMPVLMSGGLIFSLVFQDVADVEPKRFAVIDRTPDAQLGNALAAAAKIRTETAIVDSETGELTRAPFVIELIDPPNEAAQLDQVRLKLSDRVRSGEFVGFLEIGPESLQVPMVESQPRPNSQVPLSFPDDSDNEDEKLRSGLRYQTHTPTYTEFAYWARRELSSIVHQQRLEAMDLEYGPIALAMSPLPLDRTGLTVRGDSPGGTEGAAETQQANEYVVVFTPLGIAMLMFMTTLIGTTPLMQGVIEEKSNRIAEVLLGSLRPFELMLGKLMGMVGVSLTILAVYLGGIVWGLNQFGYTDALTPSLIIWFLVYQVVSVLMFGSLFVAVGAACADAKEAQSMVAPVMTLLALPLFACGIVLTEPNSQFISLFSLIPTASPTLMTMRMAIPPGPPSWQPYVGLLGALATTAVFLFAAARIFRVGILMQGQGANFKQMIKWVFSG